MPQKGKRASPMSPESKTRNNGWFKATVPAFILWTVLFPFSWACALTPEEISTIKAYERVAPSVVNITTELCETEFFFCATPARTGSGSGVVIREDGLIVTNSHVISGAQSIRVVLSDGRNLDATLAASSPEEDLAIIKVDPGEKQLKAITLTSCRVIVMTGLTAMFVPSPDGTSMDMIGTADWFILIDQ